MAAAAGALRLPSAVCPGGCLPPRVRPSRQVRRWSSAPKRRDFEDPSRYPGDLKHAQHSSPEVQEAARQAGTPDSVMQREQELDLHAYSHADRAEAHQHTFPELIHGQPGEQAVQLGMSEEHRQLMDQHMAGKEGQGAAGGVKVERVRAEDPRAYGAPDVSATTATSGINEPDVGSPLSAAGREGGGTVSASPSEGAPSTAGMKPRQNKSPPVDDAGS